MPVLSQFGLPGPSLLAVKLRGLRTSFFPPCLDIPIAGQDQNRGNGSQRGLRISGAGEVLGKVEQRRDGKGGRVLFPEQVRDGDGGGGSGVLGE